MKSKSTKQLPNTILFTHYGDNWIRGSERCLLDLIKHLDKTQFTAVLWCNQPIMKNAASHLGITVYCTDFPVLFGWQAPRFNVIAFIGLINNAIKMIKRHDIKLIHANSATPCQWLTVAAKKTNVPLVCHLHSAYQLRDRLTLGLYQTNLVVGVSRYVVEALISDHKPTSQIEVISNGIDTVRLQSQTTLNLRESLNIAQEDFVIASLGSLIHRKGVDLLIEAVESLIVKQVKVHLLIIGEGPESHHLKAQVSDCNLHNHISLIGERDNGFGILRGTADLYVSAAREEAFGLVFAEASLAGLAIIAPKIGGIPDVVVDQETGLLFPAENVDALVNAIHTLYLSPTLCHQMAQAGQRYVLENFTIEKNCDRFQRLYSQHINSHIAHKTVYQKLRQTWVLLTMFSIAIINSFLRLTKRGLTHEG